MSESIAAITEREIRSLINILYRYMEDNGDKYNHKLTHFTTILNARNNCLLDMTPKNSKKSDFLSIPYSKPLKEIGKPNIEFGYRVRISKYDLLLRKC